MGKWLFAIWVGLSLFSASAFAEGRMLTYLEGKVSKHTNVWVVHTTDGTYWINLTRQPVWTRRLGGDKLGFWVGLDQIQRIRRPSPAKVIPAAAIVAVR